MGRAVRVRFLLRFNPKCDEAMKPLQGDCEACCAQTQGALTKFATLGSDMLRRWRRPSSRQGQPTIAHRFNGGEQSPPCIDQSPVGTTDSGQAGGDLGRVGNLMSHGMRCVVRSSTDLPSLTGLDEIYGSPPHR